MMSHILMRIILYCTIDVPELLGAQQQQQCRAAWTRFHSDWRCHCWRKLCQLNQSNIEFYMNWKWSTFWNGLWFVLICYWPRAPPFHSVTSRWVGGEKERRAKVIQCFHKLLLGLQKWIHAKIVHRYINRNCGNNWFLYFESSVTLRLLLSRSSQFVTHPTDWRLSYVYYWS